MKLVFKLIPLWVILATVIYIIAVERLRWEPVNAATLRELSEEQARTITYAAAYWREEKITKLRLCVQRQQHRGAPAIDEVRYFDGRIETR